MNKIEGDLAELEHMLRQLEHEYDQFFGGKIRIEPQRTDARVQKMIKNYSGRGIQNPGLRFKYQNIVARYNAFRKVWTRKVREQEEGRVFGRPQRAAAVTFPSKAVATSTKAPRGDFVIRDLQAEKDKMASIFDSYKSFRQEAGESTDRLRMESFARILNEKVEKMKQSRKCEKVEIRLRRDKEKTRIMVRPLPSEE